MVHAAAPEIGYTASVGERETAMKYGNKRKIGLDRAKPISYEIGRRPEAPKVAVLRNLVMILDEAGSCDIIATVT